MEPEPGRSGQQQCPSCKKIAPQFQRKVCNDCWVWFEENVDDHYHQGKRPNGRLHCPYQTGKKILTGTCPGMASCPPCRINIFLNITGYTNPHSRRCGDCDGKTILKTNLCSKCLRQQPKSTSKNNEGTPKTGQKRVSFKFSKPTPLNIKNLTMYYNGIPIKCQPQAREQLKNGCSVVLTRRPDLFSNPAGSSTPVTKPEQPKTSSSKRKQPTIGTPKISSMPGVRVTKRLLPEDSSNRDKVSKKQKLEEPVGHLPDTEIEEGGGGGSSQAPPTGNRISTVKPSKTSKKKKTSGLIRVRIPMKSKTQKEVESSMSKEREEMEPKKKSSQEEPRVQKSPSTTNKGKELKEVEPKKKSSQEEPRVQKSPSTTNKGKELKSSKKWPEKLKRSARIAKVPPVELDTFLIKDRDQSFAEFPEKPAEHPKAAANPAKLATTSTQQTGFIATPLQPPAIVPTTVDEPVNTPTLKGTQKSYSVAATQSLIGVVPLPPIGEKSRGRCLINKNQSGTTSGSESSSTAESDFTTLVNGEPPPPPLVSIKVEYSPFDDDDSNSESDEEPFGPQILPEGEQNRRVPAAPVLLPLLYSVLPQMPSMRREPVAANTARPDEDILLLLNDSDEEDIEFDNLITPKQEILSNPPSPEKITPASPSSLFPRVDPVPCLGYIRIGECKKVNCRFGHSMDSKLLFEVAQKWLLAQDFFCVKNLIFMMATPSSPFRRSLWSDAGQDLVCSIISALLNENQADLTEMALSMMTCKDIPLKSPEICERAIGKVAPTREVADLLYALYKRLEQTGLTVSVKAWNKMLSVFVLVKRWDVTCAAVGTALESHPDFTPIREVMEFLFEIHDKEKLVKVVGIMKNIQPSPFDQLRVTKREKIVKILSELNSDQDYRSLFHLPPLAPEARQNVNPASTDPVENTYGGFFNVERLTLVDPRVLNTRSRLKEPMDLRVITID